LRRRVPNTLLFALVAGHRLGEKHLPRIPGKNSKTTVIIFHKPVRGLSKAALSRFVRRAQPSTGLCGNVNVLMTSSHALRRLNRQFRGKDEPTDVLSFPVLDRCREPAGEIAISVEIARRNARLFGHGAAEEIKILVLHGLLHLAGYNHELDDGQMARKEYRLRKALRLPLALLERSAGQPRRRNRPLPSPNPNAADARTRGQRTLR
jgi:probable rRNA maturation factor